MNKPIYLLILLLICLLIPLTGTAQVTQLAQISGSGQTGAPGETLEPLIVEVRDQNGNPVSGVIVGFVHDGGGLSNITYTTDTDGRAQTTLTLPRRPGSVTIRAWVGDGTISTTFTATATIPTPPTPLPEPTQLVKISDDNLLAAPGDSLTFVVELQDLKGNPKPGVDVNFALFIPDTTGTLNPMSAETDENGRAQTTLQLPDDAAGTYEVEAFNSDDFGLL